MKGLTRVRHLAAASWLLSLLACGGGGGGGGSAETPANPQPSACAGAPTRVLSADAAQVGRNVELALLSCSGTLSELQWTQTAGPTLPLLSARSQALSIEPAAAGAYAFQLRYVDASGTQRNESVALNVAAAGSEPPLLIRGEPSVWSQGQLSLRAWMPGLSAEERTRATIQWTQVQGPVASLGDVSGWRLIFKAPAVTEDQLLQLRATVKLADGRSLSQDFRLLVQAAPAPASGALFDAANPASRVYPYVSGGPHAAALQACIYQPRLTGDTVCTLGRLPLLGQETRGAMPSIEQVMNRVLVSNDWMGEVFERFLREQDSHGDFRRLLNATTAIVIGGRVRPAFYWSYTGAIYLDADYLWTTAAQRDTISEVPDPRSDFGNALGFTTLWRYVLNNQYAGGSYPLLERRDRDVSQLPYVLGRLLYHELTHAGDFLPPRTQLLLRNDLQVWQASDALRPTPSELLQQRAPFFSQEMVGLGRVQFFGVAATAQQLAWGPLDIAGFFANDRVTDDYSYSLAPNASIPREDAAMLAEEAMMQLRYGVLRDFAITPQLASGSSSADLIVRWGQRGRVGEVSIKPRVALVFNQVMPWLETGAEQGLAVPVALREGFSWGQNLNPQALAAGRLRGLDAGFHVEEAERARQRLLERQRQQAAQQRQLLLLH